MPPAAFSNRSSFPSCEYGKGPSDSISPIRFISLWANCEYWKGSIHTSFPGIAVTHFAKRLDVQRGAHHKMTLADDILFFSIITLHNVRTVRTPPAIEVYTVELQCKHNVSSWINYVKMTTEVSLHYKLTTSRCDWFTIALKTSSYPSKKIIHLATAALRGRELRGCSKP